MGDGDGHRDERVGALTSSGAELTSVAGLKRRRERTLDLTEEVKAFCRDRGMDQVGITPLDRLSGAPPFARPENLVPKVRSVVAFLVRVNRTIQEVHREGRSSFPYASFGETRLYERLDEVALDLANLLEDRGYASCPVASNFYYDYHLGQPQLTHRYVAMAAGLGRIGWSGHLISPLYGAGVKLCSVVTEADLEPDAMIEEELCDRCMACVRNCPVEAIHPKRSLAFEIAGKTYHHTYHSKLRCFWGCAGLTRGRSGKYALSEVAMPRVQDERDTREIMNDYQLAQMARHPMDLALRRFTTVRSCSMCHMVCHPEDRRKAK